MRTGTPVSWTTSTSAPVLVVGNYFDGVTDFRGAQMSARFLRNSRLLAYAGWGHTAYGRSDCTTEHVNAYLLDGTLPPVGTVCPANPNPFITSTLRTAAATVPLVGLPAPWLTRGSSRSPTRQLTAMPSVILPTISWVKASLPGWNPPQRTSR